MNTEGQAGDANPQPQQASFWCHQCRQAVESPTDDPQCPDCQGRFLEVMNQEENPAEWDEAPPAGRLQNDAVANMLLQLLQDSGLDLNDNFFGLVTRLLEQDGTPSRQGPPPASANAIEQLEKVTISSAHQDSEMDCAVCMERFDVETEGLKMPCAHIFHPECLNEWLSQHNSCPICRFELPTDDPDYERDRQSARVRVSSPQPPSRSRRSVTAPSPQQIRSRRWNLARFFRPGR